MKNKIMNQVGELMIWLGILGAIVGAAIFAVALFSDPKAEATCDGQTMKPGDSCVGSGSTRTYDEVKSDNENVKDGLYIGPAVLLVGAAVAVVGSRLDKASGIA